MCMEVNNTVCPLYWRPDGHSQSSFHSIYHMQDYLNVTRTVGNHGSTRNAMTTHNTDLVNIAKTMRERCSQTALLSVQLKVMLTHAIGGVNKDCTNIVIRRGVACTQNPRAALSCVHNFHVFFLFKLTQTVQYVRLVRKKRLFPLVLRRTRGACAYWRSSSRWCGHHRCLQMSAPYALQPVHGSCNVHLSWTQKARRAAASLFGDLVQLFVCIPQQHVGSEIS
eukprot:m.1520984 g.1520984  ORF g.1520984 m.1520984 type:complete len:223 (-) comp25229_c0_seq4:1869-2537(-)